MSNKVFVYGTLREGQGAHQFLDGAKKLGTCKIDTGKVCALTWFPAYVTNGNTGVVGEVYEVTQEHIDRMDVYEGHPSLFRRCLVDTAYGDAFIYVYQGSVSNEVVVEHGDWVRDYGTKHKAVG